MAIGFDCRVHRGGTVVFDRKKHPRFPSIKDGELLVSIPYYHNDRGYDHSLMDLFQWLTSKRVETVNLNGYPCLFSVYAGWLRAYGIVIPDDIPNNEALWVEMWDQS